MEEADFLCDRIAIIDHGKIIALDTPQNLKHGMGGDILNLETDEKSVEHLIESLRQFPEVSEISTQGICVTAVVPDAERKLPGLLAYIQSKGIQVHYAGIRKPSLEEVFIRFTGSQVRERVGSFSDRIRSVTVRRMRR
jgi:ABC-2 type transport system ATP-binding protein